MYQQTQFDPALLSLMEVAKKVTPQGQPTVAANMMAKAGVPPQEMPPGAPQGMPPGMPPQGPPQQGLPDLLQQAQQAAPSVAQNMQEQQTAQMLAQAQPQPPMMAEGGIASLPIDDYGYADGGIIGYAGGGTSEETKKPLDAEAQSAIEEAQRTGDRNAMLTTLKNLGAAGYDTATLIPRAFMGVAEDVSNTRLGRALGLDFKLPQAAYGGDRASMTPMMDRVRREGQGIASVAIPEPQEPPSPTVNALPTTGGGLTTEAARGQSPRQEVRRVLPQASPGLPSVLPAASAAETAASLYTEEQEALKAREAAVQPAKTLDQIRAEKLAARKARGLPEDPTELARTQLTGIEALDAKRLAMEEAQKAPRLQAGMLKGLLAPGAKTLGDVFRGSAEGILGAEETERAGNISSLERQRREMTLTNEMKAAMQRAQYLELDGEFEESKKELDRALALKAKIEADRSSLRTGRRGELAEAEKSRAASEATARNYAASRQADPVYTQAYQAKLDQLVAEGGKPNDPKIRQAALEYALGQTKGYTSKERMSGDSTDVKRQALVAKNPAYQIASTMYAIETDPAKKAQHLATMEKIEADNNIGQSEPTAAPAQYAKNPKTGERIMSTDGGKTWNPV